MTGRDITLYHFIIGMPTREYLHSNRDVEAGWGSRPLGFTSSSAMNSAQENSYQVTAGPGPATL